VNSPYQQFDELLNADGPMLALAPMQDVTDLPFWKVMTAYGGAMFTSRNIFASMRLRT